MTEIVALMFAGAAVAAGIYFSKRHATRSANARREMFAAFALSQDWTYLAADHSLVDRWRGVPFGIGDNRAATDVVAGRFKDREFVAFDYSCETHSVSQDGRRSTTHEYGLVAMTMPGALPNLQVDPAELLGGEFAIALGLREDYDFNKAFRVNAVDDLFEQRVFHPRMMEFLLVADHRFSWRFEGNSLVCWTHQPHQPDLILAKLDHVRRVLDQVPPDIWRDYAGIESPS